MTDLFRPAAIALCCATTLMAGDPRDAKPPADSEKIQGTWSVMAFREGGRAAAKEQFDGLRVVINDETISFQKDQQDAMRVKYTLDPRQKPKAIDTTHEIDPGKPIIQLGIYKLEGDTLLLGIAAAGQKRPDDFGAKTPTVFELKRKFEDSSSPDSDGLPE